MVWKLYRAGRSLKHLIELLKNLQERGIEFMSLDVSSDDPFGRAALHGGWAEDPLT